MKVNIVACLVRSIFWVGIIFFSSCQSETREILKMPETDLLNNHIIPKPYLVKASNSSFALDSLTVLRLPNTESFLPIKKDLDKFLNKSTRLKLLSPEQANINSRYLIFEVDSIQHKDLETYSIEIGEDTLRVSSASAEGAFRAIQTLKQIFPNTSNDTIANRKIWPIPTGYISDKPTFEYRGTMLDVARHFFSVQEVKKHIDLLAFYKINFLHLHLSDDQGWRIEIKSYPKLTEIGGKTEVGGGEGGYYTQDDYAEIVAHAKEKFITIVPEIDMPGHTNAASLSYPFLNGNGKTLKPYTGMRVGFSTFDTRKDTVYGFIDQVIGEIAKLTPGRYFHIGGDESHVTKSDDYIYFINKVEKIVQAHGKQMIGWDEVATANLDSTSIAQFWRGEDNAQLALKQNMKLIISPGKKAYLDMKYDDNSLYGLTWAGMIPVDSAYIWTPETYLKDIPREQILGLEAPLWSETITNLSEMQYLAFPRLIGYAELGWSVPENRNWDNYKNRLKEHQKYLEDNEVNFYKTPVVDWSDQKLKL